jgi:hypothetical protein
MKPSDLRRKMGTLKAIQRNEENALRRGKTNGIRRAGGAGGVASIRPLACGRTVDLADGGGRGQAPEGRIDAL